MTQGAFKSKSKPSGSGNKSKGAPKKAAPRNFKPKKLQIQKISKVKRTHSGLLTSSTEKSLASKVGHLELLKGSRREVEKAEKKKKAEKAKQAKQATS